MSDCWQRLADILNRLELAFCGPYIDAGTEDTAPGVYGLSEGSITLETAVTGSEEGWTLVTQNARGRFVPTATALEYWQELAAELNAMHAAGDGPTMHGTGAFPGPSLAGVYGADASVCFTGDGWEIRDGNGDRPRP